jgi:hypothetical protein
VVQSDRPTNNLFFPLAARGDPLDGNILMFCKTGSDQYQSRSTEVVVVMENKIYAIFHPHLLRNEPHAPISAMAAIVLNVLKKDGVEAPVLFSRLMEIASGKVESHNVGSSRTRPVKPVLSSSHPLIAAHR